MHNPLVAQYDFHVISGGQTGVDLAGLRAGQMLGFKTGGLAPRGFKTTAGPKQQLKTTFRLEESNGGYSVRTRQNVEGANATLVLARDFDSSGTKLTIAAAVASGRPYHRVNLPDPNNVRFQLSEIEAAVAFIKAQLKPEFKLNIAGNSSRTSPGVFIPAFVALIEIFGLLAQQVGDASDVLQLKASILADGRMVNALNDNFDYHGEIDPRGLKGLII